MNFKRQLLGFICGFLFLVSAQAQQPGIPNKPGTVGQNTSTVDMGEIEKTLNYVNSLFSLYNEYNSSVSANSNSGEIIFTDKFSELRGYASEVEFRRDGELMGLYCKSGNECLRSKDATTGVSEDSRIKYTFGMKENGEAVPEMDRAISKLNGVLKALQGSGSSSSNLSAVASANLNIINDAFRDYNNYGTVFSVRGKQLYWDSTVANVHADLNKLTFYIDYENQWMVMRCTEGDCLQGSVSKDSYSMGLNKNGKIAPTIEKVLQAFNNLRREVLTN
jgi:hypothetical protein